jgi:predicted O-linked N-acetylglucosamine transferase (SPINDLY family)
MAQRIYRQILDLEPCQADATHLLGVVALQTGQYQVAVDYITKAISWDGTRAIFHSNLGEAYRALKRTPEAIACYRRALQLNANAAGIHYNLANALKDQGQLDEAIRSYQQALQLRPDDAATHNNLGNALRDQGRLDEAVACFRRAIQCKPDSADAHNNLGNALKDLGRAAEAVGCYRRAIELAPALAQAHCNLGNALQELGQSTEAQGSYQRALQLKPEFAEAHLGLACIFQKQGQFTETVRGCQRAIQAKPDYAEAHNNLGVAWRDQGRIDEALACFDSAMTIDPAHASAHSNRLFTLQYRSGVSLRELADAHDQYQRRHAAPLQSTWRAHDNSRDPRRRLRVGFLSPDLHSHPVGYFLVRVLEHLDRGSCETVGYSDRQTGDDLTARLRAAVAIWREVAGLSDQRLAEQIRADRIDILFDLAGHTAHNRLLVFARKPAPIQITWIGYEGTTGLAAMDYLLADRHVVPAGAEPFYREKVLRLPDGYLCYDPPLAAPPVGPLPAAERGYVTFGSFNNLTKITPEVVAVWAEILRGASRSRLVLKYKGLSDVAVRGRYFDRFARCGVGQERLDLLPWTSYQENLAAYQGVDIGLDPFPFSGGATTCEALWMGVPVVTLPGETFASRHCTSHLASVGLVETIAESREQYVRLALDLSHDLPRLDAMRRRLREQMAVSSLCDGRRFAANLMNVLRDVWRQWTTPGRG